MRGSGCRAAAIEGSRVSGASADDAVAAAAAFGSCASRAWRVNLGPVGLRPKPMGYGRPRSRRRRSGNDADFAAMVGRLVIPRQHKELKLYFHMPTYWRCYFM